MFRKVLQAAAVAIAGFCVTTPAHAAPVEDAIELWYGDLRTNYNYTVQYVKAGNTDDGARYAATLAQQAAQLNSQVSAIQSAAAALSPELGSAWSASRSAADALNDIAEEVAGQVGQGEVDIDDLESAFSTADDALNTSWEFTKNFGKQYGVVMGGPVENAKQLFDGAVSTYFNTTTQYIGDGKSLAAKDEMAKLRDVTFKLAELAIDVKNKAGAFSKPLIDLWTPADDAIKQFQVEIGVIQSTLGKQTINLSLVESLYGNLNAALVRSYKDILDFGSRLTAICDDWG